MHGVIVLEGVLDSGFAVLVVALNADHHLSLPERVFVMLDLMLGDRGSDQPAEHTATGGTSARTGQSRHEGAGCQHTNAARCDGADRGQPGHKSRAAGAAAMLRERKRLMKHMSEEWAQILAQANANPAILQDSKVNN